MEEDERREGEERRDVTVSAPAAMAHAEAPAPQVTIGTVVARAVVRGEARMTLEALTSVGKSSVSVDEAVLVVENASPSLADWLRPLLPKSRQEFLTYVIILVALLNYALPLRDSGLSEEEIARLIDQAVTRIQPPQSPPLPDR